MKILNVSNNKTKLLILYDLKKKYILRKIKYLLVLTNKPNC